MSGRKLDLNSTFFDPIYKSARDLEQEEKRPGGKPENIDFSIEPTCFMCQKSIENMKPLRCSACKAVLYCSKGLDLKCSAKNWKQGTVPRGHSHKHYCPLNKAHMTKVPEIQAMFQQFPWGRLEKDGSFAIDVAKARLKVLGGKGYGYWSTAGGLMPHMPHADSMGGMSGMYSELAKMFAPDAEQFMHGYQLLETTHLSEKAGWKLDAELIPYLTFNASRKPPKIVSGENIVDWDSWYKWRGLPKKSPAALLLSFPLSVYRLLVHVLKVIDPSKCTAENRRTLVVHYLGAEVELNHIPLFAELALVLPHTDIVLVFFGKSVYDLVEKAKKTAPKSLAAKTSSSSPVYSYTAPEECGGSTFKAHLWSEGADWPVENPRVAQFGGFPHALVAPNAGLLSYESWMHVIAYTMGEGLPFGVTEYAEQSVEDQRNALPMIAMTPLNAPQCPPEIRAKLQQSIKMDRPIELNPFARPGQRGLAQIRLPNVVNGFTFRVA